jgi:putative Mg2+ transporter-C (MgtC) family protein
MTTAATIWLVAAIGMAAGTGSYFLGVVGTVITVLVLAALRPVRERLSRYGAERDSQE